MSGPVSPASVAAGGQTFTIGPAAVLLTETAPIMVINTSSAARVWLGATSSVGPGSGVPLDPGTSYTWATTGTLWAILDPAATAPTASLIVTGSGTGWSPSPVAVAAATATALLTTGVPIVNTSTTLYASAANPQSTLGFDVSAYNQVTIDILSGTPPITTPPRVSLIGPPLVAGGSVTIYDGVIPYTGFGTAQDRCTITMPTYGARYLSLYNLPTGPNISVTVAGDTYRPTSQVPRALNAGSSPQTGACIPPPQGAQLSATVPGATSGAATQLALNADDNLPWGPCSATIAWACTDTTHPVLLRTDFGSGRTFTVWNTQLLTGAAMANGFRYWHGKLTIPSACLGLDAYVPSGGALTAAGTMIIYLISDLT